MMRKSLSGAWRKLPVGAAPDTAPLDAGALLDLQRTVGNSAVATMLQNRAVQRAADDPAASCGPKLDPRAICDDLHLRG
jgi:hypothetical protein